MPMPWRSYQKPEMKGGLSVQITADGSHTLLQEGLQESYHSKHGAISESKWIYLQEGFDRLSKHHDVPLRILEIGFGTGLNAMLTLMSATDGNFQVTYESVEAYPVPLEIAAQLNYPTLLSWQCAETYWQQLHAAGWDRPVVISEKFVLFKRQVLLEEIQWPDETFDLVYYDAFSPARQPEMWSAEHLYKVLKAMKVGAVLVTYCAQGQLKRNLRAMGATVEVLPGPPGKKEMIRVTRPGELCRLVY